MIIKSLVLRYKVRRFGKLEMYCIMYLKTEELILQSEISSTPTSFHLILKSKPKNPNEVNWILEISKIYIIELRKTIGFYFTIFCYRIKYFYAYVLTS